MLSLLTGDLPGVASNTIKVVFGSGVVSNVELLVAENSDCHVEGCSVFNWSTWRFHNCPFCIQTVKDSGPSCFVMVPEVHGCP